MGKVHQVHRFQVFKEPPSDWESGNAVACAYLLTAGKVLCLQNSASKQEASQWGIPGGKVEPGEEPIEALIRELDEELGIKVSSLDFGRYSRMFVRKPECDYVLWVYDLEFSTPPDLRLSKEHQSFRWVWEGSHREVPMRDAEHDCIDYHLGWRS